MPSGRDDEDDRRPRKSGRPRSDRARRADHGSRPGRDGADRGPRPPIKGKRRTFDIDSAPNEHERQRRTEADSGSGGGPTETERWVDEGPVRDAADRAVRRGASKPKPRSEQKPNPKTKSGRGAAKNRPKSDRNAPRRRERASKRAEQALELDRSRLERQLGATKAARFLSRLGEASEAFAEDRYEDARKALKPLVDQVGNEPALRELYGLTLYRLGSWSKAVTELEEFVRLTRSTEQHPVLADCHRALGRHDRVEELWDDLAADSPAAALVAEGRIVRSGSLADQGRLADAIAVLEAGALGSKTLKPHHLRMRYALADLYERAGEHQAARRHFESVAGTDPEFFDVRARLRQL